MFIYRAITVAILAMTMVVAIPIRHGSDAVEVLAEVGACVNDPNAARTVQ